MSLTNKVLYDIDQRNDTTPAQKETARKNIGAYEDKTAAGGGTGIPKADLASDVQSSLGKADSSVQSVTSNGQALTKSAAGAIDIPKATDTKWGVVQVVNELKDNQNVIPNSRVIKEAVDGLSAALQARATFWTVQEWQTQSAQPGDPSKIYYVGPKGVGNDQYDMYEWRTKTNSYVLTDESTISLDGYWHGAPDIVGEDTVAPFITSIEKNTDDTVKYRTCSATVGDLGLPVFMDSGVVTPADPHYMYPTVTESTSYEEVKRLVDAGYRPIFVPSVGSVGDHTRYILTGAVAKGYYPSFVFTTMTQNGGNTRYFSNETIGTVICQHLNEDESGETWVWKDPILIPNIPEPNNAMGQDVGKVLTASGDGLLYWAEKQEQSDWSETDRNDPSYILNKPSIPEDKVLVFRDNNFNRNTVKTAYDNCKLVFCDTVFPNDTNKIVRLFLAGYDRKQIDGVNYEIYWFSSVVPFYSDTSIDYANGEFNLPATVFFYNTLTGTVTRQAGTAWQCRQPDWNISDNTSDNFIKNKPTIRNVPEVTSADSGKVLKADYSGGVGTYSWEDGILPTSTSADKDKVLTVDEDGLPEWRSLGENSSYAIANGSITFTPGSYYTDGRIALSDIRSSNIEYAYNMDGWVLEKDHIYVITFNIVASVGYTEAGNVGGRIWLTGFQETDQVWKFMLDTSAVHDESLVGSAIVCPRSRGEVYLNIRYDSPSLAYIPSAYVNKAEIVDVTAIVGGGGVVKSVQSNWLESDTESQAYILNKPNIPTVGTINL